MSTLSNGCSTHIPVILVVMNGMCEMSPTKEVDNTITGIMLCIEVLTLPQTAPEWTSNVGRS